jgi:hypothetical protein
VQKICFEGHEAISDSGEALEENYLVGGAICAQVSESRGQKKIHLTLVKKKIPTKIFRGKTKLDSAAIALVGKKKKSQKNSVGNPCAETTQVSKTKAQKIVK